MTKWKPAASVIVPLGKRIVGITRGRNMQDVNFPGGRADPDDPSPQFTACRELYEETGIKVLPDDLEEILVREDGAHFTYLAHRTVHFPGHLYSKPFEGFAALYPPWSLLAPTCTYRNTASEAFRRLASAATPVQHGLRGFSKQVPSGRK